MASSSSSSNRPVTTRAEALFLNFIREHGANGGADFEMLCAQHAELADELRWLEERHAHANAMLRGLRTADESALLQTLEGNGRYTVLGEIAHGGMGRVLEVQDHELNRVLAMKVLRDRTGSRGLEDGRQRARLVNEAHILGRLEHPGIVPIHEVGCDPEGRPYFTMLRVRGKALSEIFEDVKAGRDGWTTTRAVNVLLRVCEAVAHAHSKGIVHRDLKPANVMVGPFGEVFVMDWGLARIRGGTVAADIRLRTTSLCADETGAEEGRAATPVLTMDGDVLGTPSYMPPEQARGATTDVDERSDVYSVGAMLYHLLSGRAPYVAAGTSSTPKEILAAVLGGDPEPLENFAPDGTRELASVCTKAMARDRMRRYATMSELADDLRAFLENRVVRAHATGAVVELVKWMQRHRGVVAVLALLVLVLVGSTIVFAALYRVAERRLAFLEQNPSGYRIDFAGLPSLPSFAENFDDGELDPLLRILDAPENFEIVDGQAVLQRRGPRDATSFGQRSSRVIRGDFDLRCSFELEDFSVPAVGARFVGLGVRRARDGLLVACVQRQNGGMPVESGYTASIEGIDHSYERWDQLSGRLRVVRKGRRVSAYAWIGEWRTILEGDGSDEPVEFNVYVASVLGDRGEFRAMVDDLHFESDSTMEGIAVGPVVETFDRDLGTYLVPWGNSGVAAAVDGRLEIEAFSDSTGASTVKLDSARYALCGDFDVSLDYERVSEWTSTDRIQFVFHVLGIGYLYCSAQEPGATFARLAGDEGEARIELTSGDSGRLRIRRFGSRVTLECWDDEWKELLATTSTSENLGLEIGLLNQEVAAGVVFAVDDLRMDGLVKLP